MGFHRFPPVVHVDRDRTMSGDPIEGMIDQRTITHGTQRLWEMTCERPKPQPQTGGEDEADEAVT
jgi:hypothetical protein